MTPRDAVAAVASRLRDMHARSVRGDLAFEDLEGALPELAAELEQIEIPASPVAEGPAPCACRVPIAVPGKSYAVCGRPCAPGEQTCPRHRRPAP